VCELSCTASADTIAAFIGEPVQGAGGVIPPVDRYWDAIIPVLRKHNILLLADEVITGFGRTGKMFGQETYGFEADLVSLAKGITSGYIPVGAVGISDEIADVMNSADRLFMHGFTYSGHPVGAAVALRNIQIIEDEKLADNAGKQGDYILAQLNAKLGDHRHVGEIRGKGLMTLVEFSEDKGAKTKFDPAKGIGVKLQAATRGRGLIVRCNNESIAISPPLTITSAQVDDLVNIIGEAVTEVLG